MLKLLELFVMLDKPFYRIGSIQVRLEPALLDMQNPVIDGLLDKLERGFRAHYVAAGMPRKLKVLIFSAKQFVSFTHNSDFLFR